MWSKLAPLKSTSGHLKIGQRNRCAVAAASRKTTEKNEMWSVRKQPSEICGHREPKLRGQVMLSKAFESREANSPLKGFFLLPVSYCNLEKQVCQVPKSSFPLPIILGAINKEKGSEKLRAKFLIKVFEVHLIDCFNINIEGWMIVVTPSKIKVLFVEISISHLLP